MLQIHSPLVIKPIQNVDDKKYVAHFLFCDRIGYGKTMQEAIDDVSETCFLILEKEYKFENSPKIFFDEKINLIHVKNQTIINGLIRIHADIFVIDEIQKRLFDDSRYSLQINL